jgi:PAS domain S-box-containing protein
MEPVEIEVEIIKCIKGYGMHGASSKEISKAVGIDRHTLSKYLNILNAEGKVTFKRVGMGKVWFIQKLTLEAVSNEPGGSGDVGFRTILGHILSTMPDSIVVENEDYVIQFMNESLIKKFGNRVGEKCYRVFLESDRPCRKCPVKEILHKGNRNLLRYQIKDKHGNFYDSIASPIKNPDGSTSVIEILRDVTESKRMEEDLRQSEEMYRTLFENTGTAMIVIEDDMTISHVNDEMKKLWGYSKERIEGKVKWIDLVVKEDRDRMREYHRLRRVEPDAAPKNYKFQFIHNNGEVRDAYLTAAMIPGTKKSVVSILDITDQKQMEEDLKRSETLYRTIFEVTNAPTVILDDKGIFKLVNTEGVKISGYSRKEDLEGKRSWTEFIATKKDLERMREIHRMRRTDPDNAPKNYEFLFKDRHGNLKNIYVTAAIIPGTTNSVVSFMDITERKRMEEMLRESENKYRTLVDNLTQKVFLKDKNSVYVSCNNNYARDLNIKTDDIAGKTDYDFYPREIAEKYRGDDKRIMNSGKTEEIEERYVRDGHEVIVQTVKTPIRDGENNVIGILGIFWDITEHKKMDDAVRENKEMLDNILAVSPVGIGVIEMTGDSVDDRRLGWTNDTMMKMFGFKPDEKQYMGQNASVIYASDEEYERVSKIFRESLKKGKIAEVDAKLKRRDGSIFDGHIKLSFLDPSNPMKGAVATISDISWRKQMEGKLRDSEKTLRETEQYLTNVIGSSPDAIVVMDADGIVRDWNKGAEDCTGYAAKEIVGKSSELFFADPAEMGRLRAIVLKKGKLKNHRTSIVNKNKKHIPISMSMALLRDSKGVPIGTVCVGRNITKELELERRIKRGNKG